MSTRNANSSSHWHRSFARNVRAFVSVVLAVVVANAQTANSELTKIDGGTTTEVGQTVTVLDRNGNPVRGLTAEHFAVFEKIQTPGTTEMPLPITSINGDPGVVEVVFLLDISASMTARLNDEKKAIAHLVAKLTANKPRGLVMTLIAFDQDARIVKDRAKDADTFIKAVNDLHPGNNTRLIDAMAQALKVAFDSQAARTRTGASIFDQSLAGAAISAQHPRFLVVATDSGENASTTTTWADLGRQIRVSGTTVYGVFIHTGESEDPEFPRTIEESGGKVFSDDTQSLDGIYGRIADLIRTSYWLTFKPDGNQLMKVPRTWHDVRVFVDLPHDAVITRPGYCGMSDWCVRNGHIVDPYGVPIAKPRSFGRVQELESELDGTTFETTPQASHALEELEAQPVFVVRHYKWGSSTYSLQHGIPGFRLDRNLESCRFSTQPLSSGRSSNSSPPLPTAWRLTQPLVQNGGTQSPSVPFFRAEAEFTLESTEGNRPIKVFCIRPYYAADRDLIEFATTALELGLGLKPASPEPQR